MEKAPGEAGKVLNFSEPTRNLNIKPNPDRLKRYDPYARHYAKLTSWTSFLSVFLTGLAVFLWYTGHGIFAAIAGFLSLLVLWFSRVIKRAAVGNIYESGLLMPAILISTTPPELLVMADIRTSEEDPEPLWGFKRMFPEELPCYPLQKGTRVPCAGLFRTSKEVRWLYFDARPLSWATADPAALKAAEEAIEEEEWLKLEACRHTMPEFGPDKMAVFSDKAELKELV